MKFEFVKLKNEVNKVFDKILCVLGNFKQHSIWISAMKATVDPSERKEILYSLQFHS